MSPSTENQRVVELERFTDGGLPDRIAIKVQNGHRLYMAKIAMDDSNLKALILLSHHLHYEDDVFQNKVREACSIVQVSRIETRRQEMADKKIPIVNPVETNETLFAGDMDFFEAVMADKFQFRKVMYTVAEWQIEPTVKI